MKQETQTFNELTYEWPSNLTQYEAKILLGLTATEAMATAMAFLLPVGIIKSGFGFFIGLTLAIIVLLSIKKVERFGNQPFLIYFAKKTIERRQNKEIELPLIMGGDSAQVELENWQGETLITYDQ